MICDGAISYVFLHLNGLNKCEFLTLSQSVTLINLLQPAMLDRLAHAMLLARQNYQKILIKYIATLREIHLLKKVITCRRCINVHIPTLNLSIVGNLGWGSIQYY